MYCCRENAVVGKALKLVKLQVMVLKYSYSLLSFWKKQLDYYIEAFKQGNVYLKFRTNTVYHVKYHLIRAKFFQPKTKDF